MSKRMISYLICSVVLFAIIVVPQYANCETLSSFDAQYTYGPLESNPNDEKVYNTDDYGILPNGEDISARLNSLSKEVSQRGGGIIQFSEGTYILGTKLVGEKPSGIVRLYSNIHYRGTDQANKQTTIVCNKERERFYSMFSNGDLDSHDIIFESITFDCNIDNNPIPKKNDYRGAIVFNGGKNITISKCKFIGLICLIETRLGMHLMPLKDKGDYQVDHLTIDQCEFCITPPRNQPYTDITSVGICGQHIAFTNNFFVLEQHEDINYYPNCCLEIQGKDIDISNNTFQGLTNAIDINVVDKYNGMRNINIHDNRIYNYRGIAFWSNKETQISGVNIYDNYFEPTTDHSKQRVTGQKNSILFKTDPVSSMDGTFRDISIYGNVFNYSKCKKWLSNKKEERWQCEPSNITNAKYGINYESFYSVVNLGGTSTYRDEINITNNIFTQAVFPCIYVGGKNITTNVEIKNNTFNDCSYGGKFYIISLNDKADYIYIQSNNIVDNTHSEIKLNGGLFVVTKTNSYFSSASNGKTTNLIRDKNILSTPFLGNSHHLQYKEMINPSY